MLDTLPEPGFDGIVQLAMQLCATPVALVSLVDVGRQWFKARAGFPSCETDLDSSVCAHALTSEALLVIPDLTRDHRTARNPLVTADPHLRFYAGAPLRTPAGQTLGTLCVIDHQPRPAGLTDAQRSGLYLLAEQVMAQLELRRAVHARDALLIEQQGAQQAREALAQTQVATAAAGGALAPILNAVLKGAMTAVPAADGGVIELVDGETLIYHTAAGSLAPHQGVRVPLGRSTSGACYRTNQPILLADASTDARVDQAIKAKIGVGSAVHAPIAQGTRVLGVLKLQASRAGAFSPRDLEQAALFAGVATAGLTAVSAVAAQRALWAGERRYKAVFESAIDYAIIVLDLEGQVTDWNTGAVNILGWTAEEMIGKPADVFFTPEDRAANIAAQEMHSALLAGRGIDERWHLRQSGERFWANGEMMTLRDEAGEAIGFVKILRDRTLQRLAEERLKAADERLQMALTASGVVGLWDWMVDTDLLHGDANFARLYGLDIEKTAAGLTMEEYQEFVVPEDLAPLRARIRDTFEHGADFLVEYRLAIPDQPLRWVECKGRMIYAEDGKPVRFSGTAIDITDRKCTETALSESRHQLALERSLFEAIFQQAPIGISVAGATPEVPNILNAQAEAMMGHGLGEQGDARYRDYGALHPDGRRYAMEDYPTLRALRQGEIVRAEDMQYRNARTGELRLFEVSSGPVRDAEGRIQAAATVLVDVTEQRRAEAEARRLAAIVEQSGDFIGVAHLDGRVAWVNEAGRRLVGLGDAVSVQGTKIEDYFDPAQWPEIVASVFPTVDAQGHWRGELRFRHFVTGALIPVVYDVIALQDERGATTAYATVTRDITEQKQTEAYQDILNRELSHRLKNTLAMVQAIATQTLRSATNVTQAKDALVARLVALGKAHDILMNGQSHGADMMSVVSDALQIHDDRRPGRFQVNGPPIMCGDKTALSLALMIHELATNATKYGALRVSDGSVAITWKTLGDPKDPELTFCWQERGGPPVTPPTRKGFGSRLIERGLAGAVGGEVTIAYPPEGVTCTLVAPVSGFAG